MQLSNTSSLEVFDIILGEVQLFCVLTNVIKYKDKVTLHICKHMSSCLQAILHLCLVIFIIICNSSNGWFYVGRISDGHFEYSYLNGWMTPGKAQNICENDPKCGGFTYKVSQDKV